jgi:hypothetical protein
VRIHLLEVLQKSLGTNGLTAIAGFLDESPANTEQSFFISSAVVIRELAKNPMASEIWSKIKGNEKVDPAAVLDLAPQVVRSKMANLCEVGTGLFAEVFGKSCEPMVAAVRGKIGCTAEKATSNLGLATIYSLSALRKWGDASPQPKQAVRNLLEQQKEHLGAAPAAKPTSSRKSLFPTILLAGLVLGGLFFAWPQLRPMLDTYLPFLNSDSRRIVIKKIHLKGKKMRAKAKAVAGKSTEEASAFLNKLISNPDKAYAIKALGVSPDAVLRMGVSNVFLSELAELMQQKKEGSFQIRSHVYTEKDLDSNRTLSKKLAEHIQRKLAESGVNRKRLSAVGFGSAIPSQDKELESKIEFRYLNPTEP